MRSSILSLRRRLANSPLRKPILRLRHRGLGEGDALLASYPKSGNTWVKFLLSDLILGEHPDFASIENTIPTIGNHHNAPVLIGGGGRVVKSHEPYQSIYHRKGIRAVYLIRDGRDVAVSYYYHRQRTGSFTGSFDMFLDRFLDKGGVSGYGPWHLHVESWLNSPLNHDGRMLPIRYEDLLDDPRTEFIRIARFLGLNPGEARIDEVIDRNTAAKMRNLEKSSRRASERNDATGISFVRSAKAGEWRHHFDQNQLDHFMTVAKSAMELAGYR